MGQRHITEATMRVRDALYECLLKRLGEPLTEELARERANNGAHYVMEALHQLAEEYKPPPVRLNHITPAGLRYFEEGDKK